MGNRRSNRPNDAEAFLAVLASRYSRDVLRYIQHSSGNVASVSEIGDAVRDDGGEEAERVAVRLHHVTLPKLADLGAVEYDARNKTVRYRGHPELESLVNHLPDP